MLTLNVVDLGMHGAFIRSAMRIERTKALGI